MAALRQSDQHHTSSFIMTWWKHATTWTRPCDGRTWVAHRPNSRHQLQIGLSVVFSSGDFLGVCGVGSKHHWPGGAFEVVQPQQGLSHLAGSTQTLHTSVRKRTGAVCGVRPPTQNKCFQRGCCLYPKARRVFSRALFRRDQANRGHKPRTAAAGVMVQCSKQHCTNGQAVSQVRTFSNTRLEKLYRETCQQVTGTASVSGE